MIDDPGHIIQQLLLTQVKQRRLSHYYAACGKLGDPLKFETHNLDNTARSCFDLASMTKALVATPLVFNIKKDQPDFFKHKLSQFLSKEWDFAKAFKEISIESVLNHTSGLPAWLCFYINGHGQSEFASQKPKEDIVQGVIKRSLSKINPTQGFLYSDVGFILLGLVLEKVYTCELSGAFEDLLRSQFSNIRSLKLGYLAMVQDSDLDFITTGFCKIRNQEMKGIVNDVNCAALNSNTAHAGLFATPMALLAWVETLLSSDLGQTILAENADSWDESRDGLLGWRRSSQSLAGFLGGETIGHWGWTGTGFWIHPKTEIFGILLTNRVISGQPSHWNDVLRESVFNQFQRYFY